MADAGIYGQMRALDIFPIFQENSADSKLLRLVKHQTDPSIAMPRSQTPGRPSEWLKPQQINVIETWIDQGATNN